MSTDYYIVFVVKISIQNIMSYFCSPCPAKRRHLLNELLLQVLQNEEKDLPNGEAS